MCKGIIKNFLIILFLFGLWMLLLGYFPFLLFFVFLILMMSTYLLCYSSMQKTTVTFSSNNTIIERQEHMRLEFRRCDSSAIHCGKIYVKYRVFKNDQCITHRQITIEDDKAIDILELTHCGFYRIEISEIQCYDLLQCFYRKKACYEELNCYVFPSLIEVQLSLQETTSFYSEADEYSPYHKGEDYAEVFDVRPFRETDSLRHIHWKVSMKKDELYVKEGSQPILKKILLAIEFNDNDDQNDNVLDRLYSLCCLFSKRQIQFQLLCSQDASGQLEAELICQQDHLRECMKKLLKSPTKNILSYIPEHSMIYIVTSQGIEVFEK